MLAAELRHLFPGTPKFTTEALPELTPIAGLRDGSVLRELVSQLADYLDARQVLGYRTLVVGLSNGVDSAVACELAHRAAPDGAWAVTVDFGDESIETIRSIARAVGISHIVLDGREAYASQLKVVPTSDAVSRIHLRSRIVVTLVHQFAESRFGLVVDTTDRSERVLRLYEEGKRGHVAPLIDLYKSEVFAMAEALGIGDFDESESGCPELNNLDAFGLPWSTLDRLLHDLEAEGASAEGVAASSGLDPVWIERLVRRIQEQPLRTDTEYLYLRDSQQEHRDQERPY